MVVPSGGLHLRSLRGVDASGADCALLFLRLQVFPDPFRDLWQVPPFDCFVSRRCCRKNKVLRVL